MQHESATRYIILPALQRDVAVQLCHDSQTEGSYTTHLKHILLNSVLICNTFAKNVSWTKYHCKSCKKYQITGAVLKRNKIHLLGFFLYHAWLTLNKNIKNQNNKHWCYENRYTVWKVYFTSL